MEQNQELKKFYKKVYQLNLSDEKSDISEGLNREINRNIESLQLLQEKHGKNLSEDFNKSIRLLEMEKERIEKNIINKEDKYGRYKEAMLEYFDIVAKPENNIFDLELRFNPMDQVNKNVIRLLLTELKKSFQIEVIKDEDWTGTENKGILRDPCADIQIKIKSSDYALMYKEFDKKLVVNDFDLFFKVTPNSEKVELRKKPNFLSEYFIEKFKYFNILNQDNSMLSLEDKNDVEKNISGVVSRPAKTKSLSM